MKIAKVQGRTEGEQWFHLSETPVDLYAYRERNDRWEPVALTWRGHARLRDIESFIDAVNNSRLRVIVHAFADYDSFDMPLQQWRQESIPGVKFLRFELFDSLPVFIRNRKPDLAAWSPIHNENLEKPVESDIGVLVSPLKARWALSDISILISKTSKGKNHETYEMLKEFFEYLKSQQMPLL